MDDSLPQPLFDEEDGLAGAAESLLGETEGRGSTESTLPCLPMASQLSRPVEAPARLHIIADAHERGSLRVVFGRPAGVVAVIEKLIDSPRARDYLRDAGLLEEIHSAGLRDARARVVLEALGWEERIPTSGRVSRTLPSLGAVTCAALAVGLGTVSLLSAALYLGWFA